MLSLQGYFTDVTQTEKGLYSLEQLYNSKDCSKPYWTPKRWLAQKRTKELFKAYVIEPSLIVPEELAVYYALEISPIFASSFYRKIASLTTVETSV